jgi:hypothetical protein
MKIMQAIRIRIFHAFLALSYTKLAEWREISKIEVQQTLL